MEYSFEVLVKECGWLYMNADIIYAFPSSKTVECSRLIPLKRPITQLKLNGSYLWILFDIYIEREVRVIPNEIVRVSPKNLSTEGNSWSRERPPSWTPPLYLRQIPESDKFVNMSSDGTWVSTVAAIQGVLFSRQFHINDPQWFWMSLSSSPISLYPSLPGQKYFQTLPDSLFTHTNIFLTYILSNISQSSWFH